MMGFEATSAIPASRIQSYTHELESHPALSWWACRILQRTVGPNVNRQRVSLQVYSFRPHTIGIVSIQL